MKLFLLILSFTCFLTADVSAHDSIIFKRNRFLPDHLKAQFAGGIGVLSMGVGYDNRKKSLEGELYYGYVPKNLGGLDIHMITGKLTWLPLKSVEWKTLQWRLLTTGLLISYTPGNQYFLFDPENYSFNYYKYSTAISVGAFIGGQVGKRFESKNKTISLYYELGTNERAFSNFILNSRTIGISEVFHLGIGIKSSFQ
jgi:hypothetical protein